jgi:hypothetical protein
MPEELSLELLGLGLDYLWHRHSCLCSPPAALIFVSETLLFQIQHHQPHLAGVLLPLGIGQP